MFQIPALFKTVLVHLVYNIAIILYFKNIILIKKYLYKNNIDINHETSPANKLWNSRGNYLG